MNDEDFKHTNPDIDIHAMGEMQRASDLEAVQMGRAHSHAFPSRSSRFGSTTRRSRSRRYYSFRRC